MEKYLLIGLVVLGLFLFGCAGTSGNVPSSGGNQTTVVSQTQTTEKCELTLQGLKNKCVETCKNTTTQDQNEFSSYNISMTANITEVEAAVAELNNMIAQQEKEVAELTDNLSKEKDYNTKNQIDYTIRTLNTNISEEKLYVDEGQKVIDEAKAELSETAATIANNDKKCFEKCDSFSETDLIGPRNNCYIAGRKKTAEFSQRMNYANA